MKKIIFSFLLMFCSATAMAQNVRKIPFLPYLQASTLSGTTSSVDTSSPFQGKETINKVATIYFSDNTETISRKDIGTLQSVVSQAQQGNRRIFLLGYHTPNLSRSLTDRRLSNLKNALEDIGGPQMLITRSAAYRERSVIPPNRIDIFLQ